MTACRRCACPVCPLNEDELCGWCVAKERDAVAVVEAARREMEELV